MTSPKVDNIGDTVSIDPNTGLMRIDGLIVCKVFVINDAITLQFKDGDKLRSKYRDTCFIEIPLNILMSKIAELMT